MKRRSLRNVMARHLLVGTGDASLGRVRTALVVISDLCVMLESMNGLHWRWSSGAWARTSDGAGVEVFEL